MVTGPLLLGIFVLSIAFVLLVIIKFKTNPFISLLLTCLFTGILVGMPLPDISKSMAVGFGNTLKGIGIVIGLGIILGRILSESHATEKIAETLVRAVGNKRSTLAVALTGYLVSIPVFMDAAFVILISVVKKLSNITKTPMITMVGGLSVSLLVSHNLIIPTPGPVEVANNVQVSMGAFSIYGLLIGLPAILVGGWLYQRFIGRKDATYFETEGMVVDQAVSDSKKPGAFASFFVLILPIMLMLVGIIMALILSPDTRAHALFAFIGDKNIALLASVLFGTILLGKYMTRPAGQIMSEAAEKSGMILLITGAGGAFGYIINSSGIGNYLVDTLSAGNVSIIWTGFLLAALLRGALGSSTVSLVTASTILGPVAILSGTSPILVALAICAGGNCLSLPNDSGFWVVNRFSGFSLKQTFTAWSLGATLAGVVAFVCVLILSAFSGVLPGLH
mgnify:CR=1 FL=1